MQRWLEDIGFGQYKGLFGDQEIDGEVLLTLKEVDLTVVPKIGDRKKLFKALELLKTQEGHPLEYAGWQNEGETVLSATAKLIFAIAYLSTSSFITALSMTIAHARLPDRDTFPPLPDVLLDNIPLIPRAFEVCEWIAAIWCTFFFIMLVFHRHRVIIFRRICVVAGTLFLLRSVTMFATSMSVPGEHLECKELQIDSTDVEQILQHAWFITKGLGMSINGVRTCGDYMFSGHTLILTIVNYAMLEYTPYHWRGFHILSWLANVFGMFFILAAHEHYSIDVIISFYISSRLFQYYHTVVNAAPRKGAESHQKLVTFDYFVFSYMEEDIHGVVPNDYEWPWEAIRNFIRNVRRELQPPKLLPKKTLPK